MEWKPIETAPKDGTLVLLVTAHASPISGYFAAYWSTEWEMWRFHNEGFVRDPTHWMPLPEPPADTEPLDRLLLQGMIDKHGRG